MSDLTYGRDRLADAASTRRLEWLVTNGIGGLASGTLGGALARRQHGLLFAALKPPVQRTLLLTKLSERVECQGDWFNLDTNMWASGELVPKGHYHIESFRLDGSVPTWTWAIGAARLEKRIWMEHGENTTYVQYRLVAATGPVTLALRAMVNHRDMNEICVHGEGAPRIDPVTGGLRIEVRPGEMPLWLLAPEAEVRPASVWYRNYSLPLDAERGVGSVEDHFHAADIVARIAPGEYFTVVASTRHDAGRGMLSLASALTRRRAHDKGLLDAWRKAQPRLSKVAPDWVRRLVLAADDFVVERATRVDPQGRSIMAGYPFYGDRGRDAMVALPGLAVTTGRPELARAVLTTFARHVDRGLLPNRFPGHGEPQYDSADASLWFFQAVRAYHDATGDDGLLADLYPVLEDIGAWYERGTRHGIRMDGQDCLVRAGDQLTWMDAKVNDWIVTPRPGKPVEVNALWFNALTAMVRFANRLRRPSEGYEAMARRVEASFVRFRNPDTGCLFDVIDGPKGPDATIRPNQILAVSLPDSPISATDRRAVLETCGRELLTSHGLRSLSPAHRDYRGSFVGDRHARETARHQGTVWPWLLPHYALAHERVYEKAQDALALLEPLGRLMGSMGVGALPEAADGDAPHAPRGCFAHAAAVAETLRAWHQLSSRSKRAPSPRTKRAHAPAGVG